MQKLDVFKCTVRTTDCTGDTFTMDDSYFRSEKGEVFVMASSIEEAAGKVPVAIKIERVGVAIPH